MAVEKLGQKIKELRESKEWRQEDLVNESRVPFTTVNLFIKYNENER